MPNSGNEKTSLYDLEGDLAYWRKRATEDPGLPQASKDAILSFSDHMTAKGRSLPRLIIYTARLYQLAKWLHELTGKTFQEANEEDLKRLVTERVVRNKRFSPATREIYLVSLKRAYKFWEGEDTFYPLKVAFVTVTRNKTTRVLPEELLSAEDVRKLIDAALNPRDKALVAVLFESGARIGELNALQLKHVTFDKLGATLLLPSGKTGPRRVRLLFAVPYLTTWLECHPGKHDKESVLWPQLKTKNEPMNYWAFNSALRKLAKRAGVTKRVNPHAFRHASATRLAKLGVNESTLKHYYGWTGSSNMPETYIHLSGADVDASLLEAYGLKTREDGVEKEFECQRCKASNALTARYCQACGMPLTTQAAVSSGELLQNLDKVAPLLEKALPFIELLKDEDFRKLALEHTRKAALVKE